MTWVSTAGDPAASAALSEGLCPDDRTPLTPCLNAGCPDLHGYCGACDRWFILRAGEPGRSWPRPERTGVR